jgi:hypothetical protein
MERPTGEQLKRISPFVLRPIRGYHSVGSLPELINAWWEAMIRCGAIPIEVAEEAVEAYEKACD